MRSKPGSPSVEDLSFLVTNARPACARRASQPTSALPFLMPNYFELLPKRCQRLRPDRRPGSGLVRLGLEKRKAKCGECRLSWHGTESTTLRLPCAALIAEGRRRASCITAPTGRATGHAYCGS